MAESQKTRAATKRLFDSSFLRTLERLRLVARRPLPGQHRAERRSRRTGASLEFAEHRNYSDGDDPRSLDWNAYARLDRLFVKLFHEEEDMHVFILVDGSRSMRWQPETAPAAARSKFDHARLLAAAFAYVALCGQHQVSIATFTDLLGSRFGPVRSRTAFHGILRFLENVSLADGGTALEPSLTAAARAASRKSLAVVMSDFLDPAGYERAIQSLLYRKFDVVAVHVSDPSERAPDFRGDVSLVDSETGAEIQLTASDTVVREYAANAAAFQDSLRDWCRRKSISFTAASCADSAEATLLGLVRSGALVT